MLVCSWSSCLARSIHPTALLNITTTWSSHTTIVLFAAPSFLQPDKFCLSRDCLSSELGSLRIHSRASSSTEFQIPLSSLSKLPNRRLEVFKKGPFWPYTSCLMISIGNQPLQREEEEEEDSFPSFPFLPFPFLFLSELLLSKLRRIPKTFNNRMMLIMVWW